MTVYGFTILLGLKCVLTLVSGLPVLLKPKPIVDALNFPVVTPQHLHMVKMWGVWMVFFQVLLESVFAFFVVGTARNIFGLVEGIFEIALLVEVMFDRRKHNTTNYTAVIEVTYALTVVFFFGVLLFFPDPAEDEALQNRAFAFVGTFAALLLATQIACLAKGTDYGTTSAGDTSASTRLN
jgi:hypothetical protein